MSARVEKGKRWFKFVLLMVGITAGIKALFAFGHPDMGEKLAQALALLIGGTIFFGVPAYALGWLAGKEGPAKSGDNANGRAVTNVAPDSVAVVPAPKPAEVRQFDEDAAYSQALKEIESGTVEQAIWSRAFAEAEGLDTKARALYIKLRVERMRRTT